MLDSLKQLLILHEGYAHKRYKDSEGYWTIGVGHLIDERKGGKLPTHIAISLAHQGLDVYKDDPMPDDLIDMLLEYDITVHTTLLEQFQPWTKKLDVVRHAAMADMVFNLGPEPFDADGFKDWPNFIEQVKRGFYGAAATNMLSTLWAKQVKTRATRLADMMRSGNWPLK